MALYSLLYATYGICSRQGELTDRRLVELEGQSPVFSIFLSLIHPKMSDPHRLEVSFLNPFQIEGRDNPNFVLWCLRVREREFRSESPRLSLTDLTNITQPTLEVKCDVPVEKVSVKLD